MQKDSYIILGAMSGTSLDGLDLALVEFNKSNGLNWRFQLLHAETFRYPKDLEDKLRNATQLSENSLHDLDLALGKYIGEQVSYCKWVNVESIDFIASHGHTVFHKPDKGYSLQIGSAEQIYIYSKIPVINNFRKADVKAGGQGAPLVPIGDRDLFSEYDFALNLGGIANISFESEGDRIAFDICPFNMVLNELASRKGLAFDENGQLAQSGELIPELLNKLNKISYYYKSNPKSLGIEDYKEFWQPLLNQNYSSDHLSRTYIQHAAFQIASVMKSKSPGKVLVTGGGAYHQAFINCLKEESENEIIIPKKEIVEFKEALIFAYLGLLRYLGVPNCLSAVTGATFDVSGGEIFGFAED